MFFPIRQQIEQYKVIEQWGGGVRRVVDELGAYDTKPLELADGGIDVRLNVFRSVALAENPDIDRGKPHIDGANIQSPTRKHIEVLYPELKGEQIGTLPASRQAAARREWEEILRPMKRRERPMREGGGGRGCGG